jgi:hypothetical protein
MLRTPALVFQEPQRVHFQWSLLLLLLRTTQQSESHLFGGSSCSVRNRAGGLCNRSVADAVELKDADGPAEHGRR